MYSVRRNCIQHGNTYTVRDDKATRQQPRTHGKRNVLNITTV